MTPRKTIPDLVSFFFGESPGKKQKAKHLGFLYSRIPQKTPSPIWFLLFFFNEIPKRFIPTHSLPLAPIARWRPGFSDPKLEAPFGPMFGYAPYKIRSRCPDLSTWLLNPLSRL